MQRIEIIDTTLRDGQQSPLMFDSHTYRFSLEEKKTLMNGLIKLGVQYIELFSPVVGESEAADLSLLIQYIKSLSPTVRVLAHCRCDWKDINQALSVGFDGLNLYFGTSEQSQKGHGKTIDHIQIVAVDIIRTLRISHPNLHIRFSGEDAFRTDIRTLTHIYDNLAPYCDVFGTPDTVGIATPTLVKQRIRLLKKRYPKVKLECHFHNDKGFSMINAITAVQAGAEMVDCSVWGMAERSGITSITGLLMNLAIIDRSYVVGYILKECYPLNVLLGSILNWHVPYTECVSLTNRTHIAGVHTKSVLSHAQSYEQIDLTEFGVSTQALLLGPLSGWNLILYYLREILNYVVDVPAAQEITRLFKQQAKHMSKNFRPEPLLIQIADMYGLQKVSIPTQFESKRVEILQ